MIKQNFSLSLSLGCILFGSLFQLGFASAQVTPDGTTSTTVNAEGNNFTIENGDRAGSNLFHSFQDFSVPNGGSAFFNNAEAISNIFSRVTGGNVSNIDGLIRANDANLFLINPAGIMFGSGARLDLGGGSFYGSSADSILFEDGEFSTNLENPPILTINAPIGLNFRDDPAPIAVAGTDTNMAVDAGNSFNLIGGDINLDTAQISAPGGRVELGGLSAAGTVEINENGSLAFSDDVARGDVTLSNGAAVDVRADGGGYITVNAQNLELTQGSQLIAGIQELTSDPETQAGDIQLDIVENITIDGAESGIFNNVGEITTASVIDEEGEEVQEIVQSDVVGNAGEINIQTGSLSITNGGRLGSGMYGQGNAGDVTINASENIEIIGDDVAGIPPFEERTVIFSTLEEQAEGASGDINITSNSLALTDRGELRTSIGTGAEGTAGDIIITTNSLFLSDRSRFTAGLVAEAIGTGGNIEINADSVTLDEGARLLSELGDDAVGDAGNIEINADSITLDGLTFKDNPIGGNESAIEVEVGSDSIGNGGNIEINANSLSLSSASNLESIIVEGAEGEAGNIIINTGLLSLDRDARIETSTEAETVGNAGTIEINANTVRLTEGAKILSSTAGQGDAGTIEIEASDSVIISGTSELLIVERIVSFVDGTEIRTDPEREGGSSGLFTSVIGEAVGQGGNISIITPNLQILDGAVVNAIVAPEAEGQGASILINADTLEITDGGQILAASFGDGDGGNINLNVSDRLEISGSDPTFSERLQAQAITRRIFPGSGLPDQIESNEPLTEEQGREQFGSNFVGIGEESQISGVFANIVESSTGNGGSITIGSETQLVDTVSLADEGRIEVSSEGQGNAGNIDFFLSDRLQLSDDSRISARSSTSSGGNITINAEDGFLVGFLSQNNSNGSDIIADAPGGSGGDITITTQAILGLEEGVATNNNGTNDIDASGETDGIVQIITPEVDPFQDVAELPSTPVEPEQTVAQSCQSDRLAGNSGGLTIKGRGNVPPEPTEPLNSDAILVDGTVTNPNPQVESQVIKPIKTSTGDIYPARGVIKTEDGRILLTAYPTDNTSQRTPDIRANCTHSAKDAATNVATMN